MPFFCCHLFFLGSLGQIDVWTDGWSLLNSGFVVFAAFFLLSWTGGRGGSSLPLATEWGWAFACTRGTTKKKMETKKVFVGDVTHMSPIAHYEFDLVPFFVRKELRLMATAKTQNLKTTCIHACSRAFALPINLSVRSLLSE